MNPALPQHNLPHLYKYSSAEAAKAVISTQQFRWSSPVKFNDPFDHQTGFVSTFSGDDLAHALLSAAESAIFGDQPFDPRYKTDLGSALRRLRAIRNKLPREEVLADLKEIGKGAANNFPGQFAALNEQLISTLTHSRVLCLTETPDNVVMWSHYADEHRGVVFRLRRLDDHRLLVARNVVYSEEPLAYLSIEEQIDNFLGFANHDPVPRVWEIAHRKHSDWAYEREWRIHIPLLEQPDGDWYSYYDEPKALFDAIFLGCRMEPEAVAQITQLARENLPNMEIYQAFKGIERIRLEFRRIG